MGIENKFYPQTLNLPDGRFVGGPQNKENQYGNRDLPIWRVMDDVLLNMDYAPGVVLSAQTGSGKSTQVPQAILREGMDLSDDRKIIVVQNRVAVAVELAKRVSEEMGVQVGDLVGFATGPEKLLKPSTKIAFVTNGVFARMVRHDPMLSSMHSVLFDEFDERELRMDIGASLVAKAQERGSNAKMMVMSATLNAPRVAEFFGGLPVVESQGRQYPINYHFAEKQIDPRDLPHAAAEKIAQIHTESDRGDVLVFMPGKQEIGQVIAELGRMKLQGIAPLPLHGELTPEERQRIFAQVQGRKVVVSTNIAERGLTINGIRHVVDSGLARMTDYDPRSDVTRLLVGEIAKDAIRQRAGRGGRTEEGDYHALFTKEQFDSRPDATKPEIQRSTLRDVVLQIKAMGYSREGEPLKIMDMPEKASWKSAKAQLRALGALDPQDETKLSEFGQKMAELPCDSRDAAMLLHSAEAGCTEEMLKIVAARMSRRLLYAPQDSRGEAAMAHDRLPHSQNSDLISLMKVVQMAEQKGFAYAWAREHFISYPALQEVRENMRRLRDGLKSAGIKAEKREAIVEDQKLCEVIAKGFPDKVYERYYGNVYRNPITGHEARLGRESRVVNAEKIVANELVNTGRGEFISIATKLS